MPYQICHHGLTNAYRPRKFFLENHFGTDLPVKCNLTAIITLKTKLTPRRYMLLLEHNKGETQCHKCPVKPTKTSCKPVASMPQSHTQSKCHPSLAYTSSPNKPCMPTKKSITSPSSTAPYTTSSNPL